MLFRKEWPRLANLAERIRADAPREATTPFWIIAVHLALLAWTVFTAHTPPLFIGGFLFFLVFREATSPHQGPLDLRGPLLVGCFLAGLVIHGSLQGWWVSPILAVLGPTSLLFGAAGLTAVNDNAAITYLASQVPALTDAAKFAVVAGAVAGGGLTVLANAPNPAGQALLGRYFAGGISPLRLLAAALPPTLLFLLIFLVTA
ncbi:MAG: putative Na+/H+ antiporter [Thermoanaerobaculia bacterium]